MTGANAVVGFFAVMLFCVVVGFVIEATIIAIDAIKRRRRKHRSSMQPIMNRFWQKHSDK